MKYSRPEIELLELDVVDVIRTSSEEGKEEIQGPTINENDTPAVPIFPK